MAYLTVAEADAYFEGRIDSEVWTSATDERKLAALTTATRNFEKMQWVGTIRDPNQKYAWPRLGHYFSIRHGYATALPEGIPADVLEALCETALHLLANKDLMSDSGSLIDLKVGPIELRGMRDARQTPPAVYEALRPFLSTAGGTGRGAPWWRAN